MPFDRGVKRGILATLIATATAGTLAAQTRDSVKTALVHQILERTHAADQAIATMETSVSAQKLANPRIPPVFWDRFLAQAHAQRGQLEDMIAAIYARHFTAEELRQLLAFYDTPVGQKLLTSTPTIMQESFAAGQAWGQRIGAAVGAQLEAEGVHISP